MIYYSTGKRSMQYKAVITKLPRLLAFKEPLETKQNSPGLLAFDARLPQAHNHKQLPGLLAFKARLRQSSIHYSSTVTQNRKLPAQLFIHNRKLPATQNRKLPA